MASCEVGSEPSDIPAGRALENAKWRRRRRRRRRQVAAARKNRKERQNGRGTD